MLNALGCSGLSQLVSRNHSSSNSCGQKQLLMITSVTDATHSSRPHTFDIWVASIILGAAVFNWLAHLWRHPHSRQTRTAVASNSSNRTVAFVLQVQESDNPFCDCASFQLCVASSLFTYFSSSFDHCTEFLLQTKSQLLVQVGKQVTLLVNSSIWWWSDCLSPSDAPLFPLKRLSLPLSIALNVAPFFLLRLLSSWCQSSSSSLHSSNAHSHTPLPAQVILMLQSLRTVA